MSHSRLNNAETSRQSARPPVGLGPPNSATLYAAPLVCLSPSRNDALTLCWHIGEVSGLYAQRRELGRMAGGCNRAEAAGVASKPTYAGLDMNNGEDMEAKG